MKFSVAQTTGHWDRGYPNQDFMIVPMWHCIDKVMWLRRPMDKHVGTGSHSPRPVQVQRYMGS